MDARRTRTVHLRVACTAALVALLLVSLAAGCGSEQSDEAKYLDVAGPLLDGVTKRLAAVRDAFGKPFAEQGGMAADLAALRTSVKEQQEKLDLAQPPESCKDLHVMLRNCLSSAREIADVTTPFADYLGNMAPIGQDINGIMKKLADLKASNGLTYGMAPLKDLADNVYIAQRAVVPPPEFRDSYNMVGRFIQDMNIIFQHARDAAARRASEEAQQQVTEARQPPQETDAQQPGQQESEDRSRKQNTATAEQMVAPIPEQWAAVVAEFARLVDAVNQTSGLKAKNVAFDDTVLKALAEIKRLEGSKGD